MATTHAAVFVFVVILFLCDITRGEQVFSATSKLENLLEAEKKGLKFLEDFIQRSEERLSYLKKFIKESKEISHLRESWDAAKYVANPIHAYLLVKRLTVDWASADQAIKDENNATQDMSTRLNHLREFEGFPVEDDLHGAALALVRLQDTYNLNVTAMVDGELKSTDDVTSLASFRGVHRLTARDCLFLGKHSFNRGYYDKAVLWFEAALGRVNGEVQRTTHPMEIEPLLNAAIKVHNEVLHRQGPQGPDWQTQATPISGRNIGMSELRSRSEPRLFEELNENEELENYNRLCRGERLRPHWMDAELRCRWQTRNHPALILQPLRTEEMSLDPYIIIIHDLISPDAAKRMVTVAEPKLETSKHRNPAGGFQKSWKRTSQNAWVVDGEDGIVDHFNSRIELATGLRVQKQQAAEEYQVANYGIGGLYVPHTDFLSPLREEFVNPWDAFVGDRVATLMVYLSDVDAGGATVFPRAGVTLWPKKGSAAFWFNLYKNGRGDDLTRHGACPVLLGSKWVANKWIRHHEQMFSLPSAADWSEKIQGLIPVASW